MTTDQESSVARTVARSEPKEGGTVARSARGRWAPKLSAEQRLEVLDLYECGMPVVHIANAAGVNRCTIHRIIAQDRAAKAEAAAIEAERIAREKQAAADAKRKDQLARAKKASWA